MDNSLDSGHGHRLEATTDERRTCHRYASAHDELTLVSETTRRVAIVRDAAPGGMGLDVYDAAGLDVGHVVTIDGKSGPVRAAIRYVVPGTSGTFRVGVEWSE